MSSLDCRQGPPPDNFSYVMPVEDECDHNPDTPFCWNPACGCHKDQGAIAQVAYYVTNGLMTPEEATDFVLGKLL
jgi:hypothetical protein